MGVGASASHRVVRDEPLEKKGEMRSSAPHQGEAPPYLAIRAAEQRGDLVMFNGPTGERVVLCLCKRKRLELLVDKQWIEVVDHIRVTANETNYTVTGSSGRVIIRLPRVIPSTLLLAALARIADAAMISHNLWDYADLTTGEFSRCKHCGHFLTRVRKVCIATRQLHDPATLYPHESRPLWNDATNLPPGAAQGVEVISEPTEEDFQEAQKRGRVLTFLSPQGTPYCFAMDASHLHCYEGGEWKGAVTFLESQSFSNTLRVFTSKGSTSSLHDVQASEDLKDDLAQLADLAGVQHAIFSTDYKGSEWECGACLYINNQGTSCRVCGAQRIGPTPSTSTCSSSCPSSPRSSSASSHRLPLLKEGVLCTTPQEKRRVQRECSKCHKGAKSTVLMPCRHLCVCRKCGEEANTCPQCNSPVSHRLEVWA